MDGFVRRSLSIALPEGVRLNSRGQQAIGMLEEQPPVTTRPLPASVMRKHRQFRPLFAARGCTVDATAYAVREGDKGIIGVGADQEPNA